MTAKNQTEELTSEEIDAWYETEIDITNAFEERDIPPNDAINLLMIMAGRIAVMCDVTEEEFIEGTREIYIQMQIDSNTSGTLQ